MSSFLLHATGAILALALLEAILSADNAVAIAALVRDLEPPTLRQKALNWGLVAAFILRFAVIVLTTWMVQYSQVQILGGLYLVWLAVRHFQEQLQEEEPDAAVTDHRGLSLTSVISLVALTDLAFSLDSVTAAVAVTDEVWLVVVGGAMGVAMLRFLAGWVLVWMETFVNLQNAAYLSVLTVGLRLVAKVSVPQLAPSEPMLMAMMVIFFIWGFSGKQSPEPLPSNKNVDEPVQISPITSSSGNGVWIMPVCTKANTTSV